MNQLTDTEGKDIVADGTLSLPAASARHGSIGWALTGVWLALVAALLVWKRGSLSTLTLDQWGTFLGGITGPVALLWLVLGYLQQGRELQLNTTALRLQAEELRNQVAESRALVDHTAALAKTSNDALAFERNNRSEQLRVQEEGARAAFEFVNYQPHPNPGVVSGGEAAFNSRGGRLRKIRVAVARSGNAEIQPADVLERGMTGKLLYTQVGQRPAFLTVHYLDDLGKQRKMWLELGIDSRFSELDREEVLRRYGNDYV